MQKYIITENETASLLCVGVIAAPRLIIVINTIEIDSDSNRTLAAKKNTPQDISKK